MPQPPAEPPPKLLLPPPVRHKDCRNMGLFIVALLLIAAVVSALVYAAVSSACGLDCTANG